MREHSRYRGVLRPGETDDDPPGNEFDSDATGRGDSYRRSQLRSDVRITGILTLMELALDGPVPELPAPDLRVLDVLGGDGTLARALAARHGHEHRNHWILTGDLSPAMSAAALRYGLPAVCQPAQQLKLNDGTFDAVLLAFGTHHIPVDERKLAYAEAWRVLKPGGRVVVHDFPEQGPVARWFADVVDRFTVSGHQYQHFSPDELHNGLGAVGFHDVRVRPMYDPFEVQAPTAEEARAALTEYVCDMYGLVGLRRQADWPGRLWALMEEYFSYPRPELAVPVTRVGVARRGAVAVATMPRVAISAVGVK
jgi:SAM-dependent methyltransferase